MSDYLNYDDYVALGGDVEEIVFNRYAFKAENAINYRTFDRILKLDLTEQSEQFIQALHRTMYELINLYIAQDGYMGLSSTVDESGNSVPNVSLLGQSNDGVTVTYNVAQARDAISSIDKKLTETIELGLNGVTTNLGRKLLWRGIYPDE